MELTIITKEDIVEKYSNFSSEAKTLDEWKSELSKLTKDELVEQLAQIKVNKPVGSVQELAKAILKDEELLTASYEDIAEAIRELIPDAKTSPKSIASYVSKKREEWNLPMRYRISKPRKSA